MMINSIKPIIFVAIAGICMFFTYTAVLYYGTAAGNPIPVYPDVGSSHQNQAQHIFSENNTTVMWISGLFIIDFFLNLLILYGGLYLLERFKLSDFEDLHNFFQKKMMFLGACIITLAGLLSEMYLLSWVGGMLGVLIIVFLSYVLVSRYLLELQWANSIRIALIAVTVNIAVWSILSIII